MSLVSRRLVPIACLAAAAIFGAAPAGAALYKWTDANGHIVYSDQPPPTSIKSETLKAPPPPANPNASKEMATRELEYRQRQVQKAESAAKADKDAQAAKLNAENCTIVKGQMTQLGEENLVLYRVNEKGERVAMDAAARRAERDRLGRYLREKCVS